MGFPTLLVFAVAIVHCTLAFPADLQQIGETLENKNATNEARRDNPEERGTEFEGDILIEEDELLQLKSGIKDTRARWPNKELIYQISDSFSSKEKNQIREATRMISDVTCIRFRERTNQNTYVLVKKEGTGCSSRIGMEPASRQPQPIKLANWCFDRTGTIAHEFIHALGFWHEHTRPDRNDWVFINAENIENDSLHNFDRHTDSEATTFNVGYDYGSVMHYSQYAFAKDSSKKTIIPRKQYDGQIGQRAKLSDNDIQKLKAMYNC